MIGDKREVTIGSRSHRGPWKTFTDFLGDYLRGTLGTAWGKAELSKPRSEQHPVIQWHQALAELQNAHRQLDQPFSEMPGNGVVHAFYGLAYDLYVVDHNFDCRPHTALWDELLERLRHPNEFVGARYEFRVAAMMIRAGFKLSWIGRTSSKQSEFIATFPDTGAQFAVECKIRQASSQKRNPGFGKFTSLVVDALLKETSLQRLIFVDLNTPARRRVSDDSSDFRDAAVGKLRLLEIDPTSSSLPPALVMITNYPDHHHLDSLVPDAGGVLEGFKMPDYRVASKMTVGAAVARRKRQREAETLMRSMVEHGHTPSSFDGTIFGVDDNPARLRVGGTYEFEEGLVGRLDDACLDEDNGQAWVFADCRGRGRTCIQVPLTAVEIDAWKRYPETFLGELRPPDGKSRGVLDLYDFFLRSLAGHTRESLVAQLTESLGPGNMDHVPTDDLAELRAIQLTEWALQSSGGFPEPTWAKRLRPPPEAPRRRGKPPTEDGSSDGNP
jgi:predicted Rdx family selenoprotein